MSITKLLNLINLKFYFAEVIDDKESEFVKMYVEYGTFYNMNNLELLKMFSFKRPFGI